MDQGSNSAAAAPGIPGVDGMEAHLAGLQAFETFDQCYELKFGEHWPHGRRKYTDNRFWPRFRQVGELCVSKQWAPDDYVMNVMDMLRKNHIYITPKDLLHPKVVERYGEEHDAGILTSNPLGDWEYLTDTLLRAIGSTGAAEVRLLWSPMMPFPAWFRVVYPEHCDNEILDLYGDSARKELAHSKRLRALVRRVAPGHLEALEQRWGAFDRTGE